MTERYRAMTRRRRLLAAIWAGVGATILLLLLVSGGRGLPRYLDSFLFGTGAAALASGMVLLVLGLLLLKRNQERETEVRA